MFIAKNINTDTRVYWTNRLIPHALGAHASPFSGSVPIQVSLNFGHLYFAANDLDLIVRIILTQLPPIRTIAMCNMPW